ncbi:MAG: MFS transporter, partial [Paracoccaceae bacterium]
MSLSKAFKISLAPIGGLAAVGMLWGAFSALVPEIKDRVGASDAEFGTALMFSAAGGMLAMYLAPYVNKYLGRSALPVVLVFLVATFFYPLLADTVPKLRVALFFMGASVAMLDILSNIR